MRKTNLNVRSLMLLLAALVLPAMLLFAQAPRRPTAGEIEEIRSQMRQRQAERNAVNERESRIPWRQLAESPDQRLGDKYVLVRLSNEMNLHNAVWTFTPGAGTTAAPIRALLCWRGEQWIALAPGRWQAAVAIGRPDSACAFRYPM